MCHLLDIPQEASKQQILIAACKAEEFARNRFRSGEKPFFNELKKNAALQFTYNEKTEHVWHKIILLCQMDSCAIDLTTVKDKHRDILNNISVHKAFIRTHLMRLLSCIVDCKLQVHDSVSIRHALELRRAIAAKCWENHPSMLKQIQGFGDGSLKTLITYGIRNLEQLSQTDPMELERIFRRNPPFGNKILDDVQSLPKLNLDVNLTKSEISELGTTFHFRIRLACTNNPKMTRAGRPHCIMLLVDTREGQVLDFRRQSIQRIVGDAKELVIQLHLCRYTSLIRFSLMCEEIGKKQVMRLDALLNLVVGRNVDVEYPLTCQPEDFPSHSIEVASNCTSDTRKVQDQSNMENDYLDIFDGKQSFCPHDFVIETYR